MSSVPAGNAAKASSVGAKTVAEALPQFVEVGCADSARSASTRSAEIGFYPEAKVRINPKGASLDGRINYGTLSAWIKTKRANQF